MDSLNCHIYTFWDQINSGQLEFVHWRKVTYQNLRERLKRKMFSYGIHRKLDVELFLRGR